MIKPLLPPPPRKVVTGSGCGFWGRLIKACHCETECNEVEAIQLNLNHTSPAGKLDSSHSFGMTCKSKRHAAFTLAETLITLLVIGVVAALTIPALMQQINERTMLKQKQTTAAKIAEGFANMRVAGALETKYGSTAEFVDAMRNYFQISQVCNSDNLSACFPETVISDNGEGPVANNVSEMAGVNKVMGLILTDGTSMLIKYNTKAEGISEGNTQVGKAGISGNTVSAATFEGLFEYIFDVNGAKSPNTNGKDILGDLSVAKGGEFGLGFYISATFTPSAYTATQCESAKAEGAPISVCGRDDDYWASAVYKCWKEGKKLPTKAELKQIGEVVYDHQLELNADTYGLSVSNTDLWTKLGSPNSGIYFWAIDYYGDSRNASGYSDRYAYVRYFSSSSSYGSYYSYRTGSNNRAICIGDE